MEKLWLPSELRYSSSRKNVIFSCPGNPQIYTDIGQEYIGLDLNVAASAYLIRAIQLRPWDVPDAAAYQSLGESWVKQKMQDNALLAWKEGAAKYPYNSALWQNISAYHLQKKEYAAAAYSASVAKACGSDQSQAVGVERILRDARSHLNGAKTKDLQSRADVDA